jgi:hypothetical protein
MKVTRRKLAATLIAGAAVLPAQTPAPPQPPATDDLTVARERMRASAAALANTKLPMATEPAFQFKA